MNHFVIEGLAIAAVLTGSTLARAQETTSEPPPAQGTASVAVATPAPTPPAAAAGDTSGAVPDALRFRFGVSGGLGFFSVGNAGGSSKVSCIYYGVDLRFGVQINDLIGVYAQPALGYYTVNASEFLAAGGLVGFAVGADFTFLDRLFVGAGIGYTIYNSPGGVSPMLRIGGYPLMARSAQKARRKGLMVGMDLRFTPLTGLTTIVMPTFNVGYEAF